MELIDTVTYMQVTCMTNRRSTTLQWLSFPMLQTYNYHFQPSQTDNRRSREQIITGAKETKKEEEQKELIIRVMMQNFSLWYLLDPTVLGQWKNTIKEVAKVATRLMN